MEQQRLGLASANEARKYLELVQTLPAEHIGPHRRFMNPSVDARALKELAPRVVGVVHQRDDRTYVAPSPWHAAAWMLDIAALVGQMAEVDQDSGLRTPFAAKHGAPVFRGQRNPEWKLIPTLFREPAFVINQVALTLFIESLSQLFKLTEEDTRMNGPYVHMAAAQHYEMQTPLLDFTADPRIAVLFACRDAETNPGQQVVVYGIPFNELASLGGAVVFSPPWVKRLYAQRGFFLDCSLLSTELDLRDRCFRLLFPPDEHYMNSVFPEGAEALLPPDPWYEHAIRWARETVHKASHFQWVQPHVELLQRECGFPPFFWDALLPTAMNESLDGFVDMCEWLALKALNGKLTYDCDAITSMWRHNEPLFRSHRVLWKFMNNQFPSIGAGSLRLDRMTAAMEAITICVEEARTPTTED